MTRKQKKTLIRIIVSVVLTGVAWAVDEIFGFEGWKALLLYIAPYLVIGYDVLWDAIRNIAHGQVFDEHFLMAIATVGAFGVGDYREASAVMIFYQVGELFQSIAVGKSRQNISALMDIRPDYAVVVRDGKEETVSPEEVELGETIVIKPGEKIPLDGEIIDGSTSVNTAALTGESLPADKTVGDRVTSGTINLSGVIHVRTQSRFEESTVAKILELVENSSEKKARAENFITRFARVYTPVVVLAALVLAVVPPLLGALGLGVQLFGEGGFMQLLPLWLNRALIFLVVSCPCALVISVPLTFFGGIGGASRAGILIKGSSYMDALAKVGVVVFDKTGTLTHGEVLVQADEGAPVVVGDRVKESSAEAIAQLRREGVVKTVMLTGDRQEVGDRIARQLGLDEYKAELMPADKLVHVEQLLKQKPAGRTLAYVGDGINDAPVLKRADVGIAMGALGCDAAIEAADVVLMDDEPRKVPLAVHIARRTIRIAHQNVAFAIGVKVAVLLLATVGLGTMWMAVFADVGVTVLAVLNAMRALKKVE